MILLSLLIIIILIIILIMIYNYRIEYLKKNLEDINSLEDQNNIGNKLTTYYNTLNTYLQKLSMEKIDIYNHLILNYKNKLENFKKIHIYLDDKLSKNIKDKRFFTKNKKTLIDMFEYIYKFNLEFDKKNKLIGYYEIFIDKLDRDLNCCATIWNINLFFNRIIKNFN